VNNVIITELISDLFNHINSKETFNYVSDLLISSLNEYKKKYPVKGFDESNEFSFNSINYEEICRLQFGLNDSKTEYLAISNDIHSILSNCPDLSNSQKLDFCDNQRYFMKLYLKKVLIQINQA
jgi:hypothetical protein